ncbi:extracellular solute-binding protein [Kaistia dalseonensis]|uniref:Multiple sugar transport system substrate-binding protein n=1 Tax=Kaistia dalseonensis TaxID=410840 RepID=A0ABU0H6F2_9HYPH|nr:extracellular solute-binding protein [Kaistia dalseonensis]MCX5495299.1 extracellular solute-binding protein [Kaistia dalseonensis]MDQ0437885.1 multiple sugar transport system substrate-binding protein [Kaistia dalseonensis]
MTVHSKIIGGAIVALLASTAFSFAEDKTVSMIQCGDAIAETYPDLIKAWEAKNPGFKVSTEIVGWAQCQDKITTLAAAGTPVGLAYVGSRTLKQFADNDLIIPIPMTDAEKAAYYPHIVETVTFKDQVWGIPVAFSTKALFWNKDLFAKAGLDPEKAPTTWDELYNDAKTIKEKTGVPGYGLPAKTMDNTMHQFLHYVYTNNGTVIDGETITLDSPQNLAALEFIKKLVPVSEEGPSAYDQDDMIKLFSDAKVAMIEGGPWVRNQTSKAIKWGVAPLPTGPEAKGPGTLLITDSMAVFKGTGVEDQAVDLAKLLTNPENQFAYEKTHGLTPLRPVAGVDTLVSEDPSWKPFLDGIANGGPEPLFLDYKGFQNAMIDMVQSVVTDKATPADALKKAAGEIGQFQ